jgi:hypothetical protein
MADIKTILLMLSLLPFLKILETQQVSPDLYQLIAPSTFSAPIKERQELQTGRGSN